MVINLAPKLAEAVNEQAQRRGIAPEELVAEALRDRFLPAGTSSIDRGLIEPQDDWERSLFSAAIDCGVSVPDSALSSDGLYD